MAVLGGHGHAVQVGLVAHGLEVAATEQEVRPHVVPPLQQLQCLVHLVQGAMAAPRDRHLHRRRPATAHAPRAPTASPFSSPTTSLTTVLPGAGTVVETRPGRSFPASPCSRHSLGRLGPPRPLQARRLSGWPGGCSAAHPVSLPSSLGEESHRWKVGPAQRGGRNCPGTTNRNRSERPVSYTQPSFANLRCLLQRGRRPCRRDAA